MPAGILTGKGVHGPADTDTEQQKEQQRPRNIFYAIHWAATAQEAERDGYQEREQQHGLQVAQVKLHLELSLPAARGFISVQRCQQIEHSTSSQKSCAVITARTRNVTPPNSHAFPQPLKTPYPHT